MAIKNPKEMFVKMLSDLRQGTEQTTKIFQEMSEVAEIPEIKQALEARVFVSNDILAKLDHCFKLIGEKPVQLNRRLYEMFREDFRREIAEIHNPVAKRLFILSAINQVIHFRIAEYMALIAAADMTGHYAVGVLLESCLAEKLAFVERTKRLIRKMVEGKISEAKAA